MTDRRNLSTKQRVELLHWIEEHKSIIFAKLSPTNTVEDQARAWKTIWTRCAVAGYNFVNNTRDYEYLKTWWGPVKSQTLVGPNCSYLSIFQEKD